MKVTIALGMMLLTTLGTFAADSKPAALSARQARTSPEWITKGVICQIQPRVFTPEGTLKCAADRAQQAAAVAGECDFDFLLFAGWKLDRR